MLCLHSKQVVSSTSHCWHCWWYALFAATKTMLINNNFVWRKNLWLRFPFLNLHKVFILWPIRVYQLFVSWRFIFAPNSKRWYICKDIHSKLKRMKSKKNVPSPHPFILVSFTLYTLNLRFHAWERPKRRTRTMYRMLVVFVVVLFLLIFNLKMIVSSS